MHLYSTAAAVAAAADAHTTRLIDSASGSVSAVLSDDIIPLSNPSPIPNPAPAPAPTSTEPHLIARAAVKDHLQERSGAQSKPSREPKMSTLSAMPSSPPLDNVSISSSSAPVSPSKSSLVSRAQNADCIKSSASFSQPLTSSSGRGRKRKTPTARPSVAVAYVNMGTQRFDAFSSDMNLLLYCRLRSQAVMDMV